MEEKKEKKIAALLRRSDTTQQTAVQVVSQYNLSSDKITETTPQVDVEELSTRVSGVEALIPKIDVKIGKVSKKIDNLKGSTNEKFQRITKEIDNVVESVDYVNQKTSKLSTLIEKQKKDNDKDSKKNEKSNNKIITILTNMLDFMKLTYEQDVLAREQQNNFSEEQKFEKERRDKELLEALKGRGKPTAEKIVDDDKRGFLEKILGAVAAILGPLKAFMSVIGTLISTVSKVLVSIVKFIGSAGKILFSVGRFLITPLGLGLLAAAAAGYGLYKLFDYAAKNMPDYSALSPKEASAALSSEAEIKKQAAVKFKKDVKDLTPEEIAQTKKSLEDTVLTGRKRAEDIDKMPAGPDRDKAVREVGGESKLKEILADKTNYSVPTPKEVDTGPERVPPRPDTTGGKNKARANAWDIKFAMDYNPDGTKKKKEPVTPATPESAEKPAQPATPAAPAATPVTPKTTEVPAPVSSATPVAPTQNLGTKVADMSTENALTKTIEEMAINSSEQVNNVMAATKRIAERAIDKIPSVRNQEETFQRMIFNSTRVV